MPTKTKKKGGAFRQSLAARDKAKPPARVPRRSVPAKPVRSGPGRPPSLPGPEENPELFAKNVAVLAGVGQIWATTKECAAALTVSEPTVIKFMQQYPEARDAYERGFQVGKISLRRIQLDLAKKNPAMAIFLGKNYLGQTDRHHVTGQVGIYDLSKLSLKQLEELDRIMGEVEIINGDEEGVTYLPPPKKP